MVYVHSLVSGQRQVVANFKGSNSAPAWSVDGKQLAVVLSKDGGSQIYLIGADGSNPRRITELRLDRHGTFFRARRSIDLLYLGPRRQPADLPHGRERRRGDARDASTATTTCRRASRSDGKTLVYIAREGGRFQLKSLDLASGQAQALTDGQHDESPSFAPNGKMILYATQSGNRGSLGGGFDRRQGEAAPVGAGGGRARARLGPVFQ